MSLLKTFGPVWGASGVQGFFGEGYWYQRLYAWLFLVFGYSFRGVTFVAKTATADPRAGNMPLDEQGISPAEMRPACIKLGFWQYLWGVTLNSVGLSNIGIEELAWKRRWDGITEPFMISFMTVGDTPEKRKAEVQRFAMRMKMLLPRLQTLIAIQHNKSCPNTEHKATKDEFREESLEELTVLGELGVPILVKINTLADISDVQALTSHPACAGIIVSNTLPWPAIPTWMKYLFFGSTTSPLAHIGGGGLSGWPLRSRVRTWIREARKAGITKHINACGGIYGPIDVWRVKRAGADSISLGSIAAVRPWMLGLTVRFAHWLFTQRR